MESNYAIFASGSGSNALALIQAGKKLKRPPSFIFVNNENAKVIEKAKSEDIRVIIIESLSPRVDIDFENKLINICNENNIKWIFLAGFMKILSENFLKTFNEGQFYRVINIHPSLLPMYKGLNAYEKAFESNEQKYGFTIHLVDEKIDHGQIIYQHKIDRQKGDSFKEFKQRGLSQENEYYPLILEKVLTNESDFINSILNKQRSLKGKDYD